jgi:hypothetical protein
MKNLWLLFLFLFLFPSMAFSHDDAAIKRFILEKEQKLAALKALKTPNPWEKMAIESLNRQLQELRRSSHEHTQKRP